MKRKRGAPPGNKNALKHGFYSAQFRQREMLNLGENTSPGLQDEINLMRVATARFLESLQGNDAPRDLQVELSILRAICLGALSINSMVRTRLMLHGGWRGLATESAAPDHSRTKGSDGGGGTGT